MFVHIKAIICRATESFLAVTLVFQSMCNQHLPLRILVSCFKLLLLRLWIQWELVFFQKAVISRWLGRHLSRLM